MSAIADSASILDTSRVLAQHQAAVILLQGRLANPAVGLIRWLDLACGRGQIIAHLNQNISEQGRAKLEYYAYDIDNQGLRTAGKLATRLNLANHNITTGDIRSFDNAYEKELRFDFVTLTNSVHEVNSDDIAHVLVDCVLRLSPDGQLFVYDMETLDPPELGAVPWRGDDAARIVTALLGGLGSTDYRPEVGRWQHTKTVGWNVTLERKHIKCSPEEAADRRPMAIMQTAATIRAVLQDRLLRCKKALEMLTKFGAETKEESDERTRLLYEFWAISRVLEVKS
ncbi:MAG TPA: class I SAM-dependent methyltransferase [Kofleriaceae bacterium]|nr:class I SAM-dependent methyltransferase [Kofleriaceae bacterium]